MVSNEKGLALPLVMFIMVVVTLLGVVLWHYSTTDIKHVVREKNRMQAYYLARSGAQLIYDMNKPVGVYMIEFEDNNIVHNIDVTFDDNIITSTAKIGESEVILELEQETGHWRN